MHLPGSRIRIKGYCKVANPEGGRLNLQPDQWLWITPIYFPGETGVGGWDPDRVVEKWSFWTNYDIDGAFIFDADMVAEVEIPDDFQLPDAFRNTPFIVSRK